MSNAMPISPVGATPTEPTVQYLMFLLDDKVFAMDISAVREIIQFGAITPVPLMPRFVRGVINLRGAVVPVIDLKARFGWDRADVGKKTCIVIFDLSSHGERTELGLMVDAVTEVVDIGPSGIEPTPQFGTVIQREYIHGLGRLDGRFVTILDPQQALDIEDMAHAADLLHVA